MDTRLEATRLIAAEPAAIFAVLCDPQGHVAIDASGMLQDADGRPVEAAGDSFVVHMDRESLGDLPEMGKYDVTVTIREFEQDRLISWSISSGGRTLDYVYGYRLEPADEPGSTRVTSFYDWTNIPARVHERGIFPVISENALKGTLGILDRTVRRGYAGGASRLGE